MCIRDSNENWAIAKVPISINQSSDDLYGVKITEFHQVKSCLLYTSYGYVYEGTYKYDDFNKSGNSYSLKPGVPHYSTETNTQPGMPKYRCV